MARKGISQRGGARDPAKRAMQCRIAASVIFVLVSIEHAAQISLARQAHHLGARRRWAAINQPVVHDIDFNRKEREPQRRACHRRARHRFAIMQPEHNS